jgi:hypothetical protein
LEETFHFKAKQMTNLPKDLHGLIFSFLWRIEAKGVPLTCKLFLSIIKSPKWFKGWRMFKTRFHNQELSPIDYDHFDTFDMVLSRFKQKNPKLVAISVNALDQEAVLFEDKQIVCLILKMQYSMNVLKISQNFGIKRRS